MVVWAGAPLSGPEAKRASGCRDPRLHYRTQARGLMKR
jgi:hypothetical protein